MDPQTQTTVTIPLNDLDVRIIEEARPLLLALAQDALTDNSKEAYPLAFVLRLLERLTIFHGIAAQRDARPVSRPAKVTSKGLVKVKHSYNAAGLCTIDHGQGICGLARQRKPRAGSAADTAEGDSKTMDIESLISKKESA